MNTAVDIFFKKKLFCPAFAAATLTSHQKKAPVTLQLYPYLRTNF